MHKAMPSTFNGFTSGWKKTSCNRSTPTLLVFAIAVDGPAKPMSPAWKKMDPKTQNTPLNEANAHSHGGSSLGGPTPVATRAAETTTATAPRVSMKPTRILALDTLRRTPSHFRMKFEVLKMIAEKPPSINPSRAASEVSAKAMQMGPATAMQMPTACCTPRPSPRICHARAHTMSPFKGNIAAMGPVLSGSRVKANARINVELAIRIPTSTTSERFWWPPNFGLDPAQQRPRYPMEPHMPATSQRVMIAEIAAKLSLPVSSPTAPSKKLLAAKLNMASNAHTGHNLDGVGEDDMAACPTAETQVIYLV
mmetsp:Transcript_6657/g.11639  ORF Transcript_6657/g.11639 Transcript_6657/m.11639 type:complete len:309 (-) Transcript_6657:16-942(-)